MALVPAGCRFGSPDQSLPRAANSPIYAGSPIYVWVPPKMQSTVGRRIAVSTIEGDKKLGEKIQQQLFAAVPRDSGRMLALIDSDKLTPQSPVQLASYNNVGTNDVVLASVARHEGIDYVLRGEILAERTHHTEPTNRLAVSWRLMSLDPANPNLPAQHVGGKPVVVELDAALQKYPDLSTQVDPETVLTTAIARDTYELFAPSIQQERVRLASPYPLPGRRDLLRGNALAREGRWGEAQTIWERVASEHPSQSAALHNLALAAVAAQDFSLAKQLARQAISKRSNALTESTLVWIEQRQRDYHKAFGLPDPPEGWFVTQSTNAPTHQAASPANAVRSIDR